MTATHTRRKASLTVARKIAAEVTSLLGDSCVKVEVSGGVRRGVSSVDRIWIVALPKLEWIRQGLFADCDAEPPVRVDRLHERAKALVESGALTLWTDEKGRVLTGPRMYAFKLRSLRVDVVSVPEPGCFGTAMALQTGPYDFSMRLRTCRSSGGLLPDELTIEAGPWLCRRGDDGSGRLFRIACESEAEFFDAIRYAYLRPEHRR